MALRRIISRSPLHTAAATCSFHQRGGGGGGGYQGGGGGGGGYQGGGGGGGYQGGGGGGGGYQGGGGGGGGYQGGGGGGGFQGGGGRGGGGGGFQGGGGRGGGGGFQGGGGRGGGGGFQGGGGRGGGGGGGFGGGGQMGVTGTFGGEPIMMEPPHEAAKKLIDLKKTCKTGRQKERTHAKIDALKVLKATSIDGSTDQKTILALLNACAFFKAPMSYSVAKDCVEWVRKSAGNLDARSIANVAYAIGAVNHGKKFDIMEKELFPAIKAAIPRMQFVELCMTLQAIGRCHLTDTADVVTIPIFQRLVEHATELNASCAATALSAASMLELPSRHPALTDTLLSQVLQPHLEKIATYHSDIVTNLANALALAGRAPPDADKIWGAILTRLNSTVANVSPNGVARMYEVVAAMRENPQVPCAQFETEIEQLLVALDAKVEQSATFFVLEDGAEIAEALIKLKRTLPPATVTKLSEGLCLMMAFHNRQSTADLGACAYNFAKARMGSPQLFRDISFLATGIGLARPPLPGDPAPPPPDFSVLRLPFTEDKKGAVARNLSHFVKIRLGVEAGMGAAAMQNPAMGSLIKYIADTAAHASAEQHLCAFREIALFPNHPIRNSENDCLILNGIIFNLQSNQHQYMGSVATPNFKDNLALSLRGVKPCYPQVAEIVKLLNLD